MAKKFESALAEGLEFDNTNVVGNSLEFYRETRPTFPAESVSKKFNAEREPKVLAGLDVCAATFNGFLPESFILLSKWWENKAARNELKKILDAEAEAAGVDTVTYMQDVIGNKVRALANMNDAIQRMCYVVTYFKPRENAKANMIDIRIDGEVYTINRNTLTEIRQQYGDDREAIKEAAKAAGQLKATATIEEL